jgi:site-specific DNA-methyltransferase (adenine-specific)
MQVRLRPTTLYHGDVADWLPKLKGGFDACLCDPPYGLPIFGTDADTLPSVEIWQKVLGLLKPGAWLLAFGAPRLWDRLTGNIRDAGFEIRDQIAWIHGRGFPKGVDVGKQIDRKLGAKRKQVWADGIDKRYFRKKGHGPQLVDGPDPVTPEAKRWDGYAATLKTVWEPIVVARTPLGMTLVDCALSHGTGALNLKPCRVGDEVRRNHRGAGCPNFVSGRWPSNLIADEVAGCEIERQGGSASFFYCPRPSPEEAKDNPHLMKKPVRLMEYLATLILPPPQNEPRRLLVPYAGSGSEILGALNAGWEQVVGIERNIDFVKVAHRRINEWVGPSGQRTQAFICRGGR